MRGSSKLEDGTSGLAMEGALKQFVASFFLSSSSLLFYFFLMSLFFSFFTLFAFFFFLVAQTRREGGRGRRGGHNKLEVRRGFKQAPGGSLFCGEPVPVPCRDPQGSQHSNSTLFP